MQFNKLYAPDDIIFWPCGTWCFDYELPEMLHKSDDYRRISANSDEWHKFLELEPSLP